MKSLYFIGPLSSDPQFKLKRQIIEDSAAQFGFTAHFPFTGGVSQKMPQIISEIRHCCFVLADLSRERPSCYFELGVAEALGADVALIAESGTRIHQTQSRNVVFYSNLADYRDVIGEIIASHAQA